MFLSVQFRATGRVAFKNVRDRRKFTTMKPSGVIAYYNRRWNDTPSRAAELSLVQLEMPKWFCGGFKAKLRTLLVGFRSEPAISLLVSSTGGYRSHR